MFSSRTTKAIQTPTTPSYVVTIRQLSGRAKERAQQASLSRAAEMIERFGGAKVLSEIQKLGGEDAVRSSGEQDPASGFDRHQVLLDGIVSWTADESVTPETIDDIEDETADLLFREILRLSRVPVTVEDVKSDAHDKKKGSRRSTRS